MMMMVRGGEVNVDKVENVDKMDKVEKVTITYIHLQIVCVFSCWVESN